MSSRTARRFAPAALLVAALAAPAPAQDKLPEAPMPRPKPTGPFEVELKWTLGGPSVQVAPPPRASGAFDFAALRRTMGAPHPVEFVPAGCAACATCGTKDVAFVIGAGGLKRVMPMPEPPRFLVPATPIPTGSFLIHEDGRVTAASDATKAPGCEACTAHGGARPSGTWYRDLGAAVVAVTFAGDEMTVRATQRDGDLLATVTFTAHHTLTKDGLVFGAITGADVAALGGKPAGMELAELSMSLQELVDHPFSFRTKMTPEGLSVSGLKCSGFERDKKELLALCGVYKHAKDGKVPELKPLNAKTGRCDDCRSVGGGVVGAALGSAVGAPNRPGALVGAAVGAVCDRGVPCERVGVDFSTPVAPPCTLPPPREVRPAGATFPNDAMKQMAAEAFGQMMLPPAAAPAANGQTWIRGTTLPSGRYLEHYPQYSAPDPAFPLPRELAAQELPRATVAPNPVHVGTWVREVGSKRCVLKVAADHFTATVSEAQEIEGGKVVTGHLTFTVDYHLARDGVTAVGLLTGVDVKFDGDLPDGDAESMVRKTGELQKMLENNPLALSLRVYADALVVGNVRMQSVGGMMEAEPGAYLGGRYRLMTEKALPPLKAVKLSPKPRDDVPPPGNSHGPSLNGAYGDLLPPQNLAPATRPRPTTPLPPIPTVEATPLTPVTPASGVAVPEPPTMSTPPAPARVMPQPKPPGAAVYGLSGRIY